MSFRADPEFATLRDALAARHLPVDAVERHWVEELAFAAWRQRRLRPLDAAALAAPLGTDDPENAPVVPSLAVLARYRGRIERDNRLALAELERARALRPDRQEGAMTGLAPAQLRWLADHIEGQAAPAPVAEDTNEPETHPSEPEQQQPTATAAAPAAARAPWTVAGTDEPDHPASGLNPQQRRRLAALEGQPFRRAA